MKKKKKTSLIILCAISISIISCNDRSQGLRVYGEPVWGTVTEETPVAKTTSGSISGENRDGIAIFRGIPYGGPCEGDARFKEPQPPTSWDGVRDCTQNGPYAIQTGTSISGDPSGLGTYFNGGHPELFGVKDEKQGENCLVLNVLTPGLDKGKRPVLFYIHGGGFATGSGTLVLGADKLAREENLVIVGVNHRLNVFGYLYLGALDPDYASSGMAGMLDLVLALQWVKDNIENFGGDPDNVTIMGESGGGAKVSTLLAMEKAKGLFNKAIVESGSGIVGTYSTRNAADATLRLLSNLGIDPSEWKQILSLPAKDILAASASIPMTPVADNINLTYSDNNTFQAYDVSKNIPLLVGASEDEQGVFVQVNQLDVNENNLRERIIADIPSVTEDNADKVLAAFEKANIKGDAPWHTYVKIESLGGFLGGGAFPQALAKANQNGAPVYQYLVRYDAHSVVDPSYRCSWHTADLPLQMRIVLHPEAEQVSKTYAHAWAAFARTGSPSTESLPWPEFSEENPYVMVFDDETHIESDPLKEIRNAFNQ